MLNSLLRNKTKIFLLVLLVFSLAIVRVFENKLFYDPFLIFFKMEFKTLPLPQFNSFSLFVSLFFRYFLNALLSILILHVCFKEIEVTKFAALLYGFFFIILILCFFYLITSDTNRNNLAIFYVRRFLIQPIFILLFVPGFYYQKKFTKN
jgi:exosortase F-associated protein